MLQFGSAALLLCSIILCTGTRLSVALLFGLAFVGVYLKAMGIQKLGKFIADNKRQLCTPTAPIRGKLIVDGWSVLREFYNVFKKEWAFGGCFADLQKVTTRFYEDLVVAGVEPIVIVNGARSDSHIDDIIRRRKKEIDEIRPRKEEDESCQINAEINDSTSDNLPILSKHVYVSSLKQIEGVQVCVADGNAFPTVVQLANSYHCPVLTNSTNYCVSGIDEGVIFIKNLEFQLGPLNFIESIKNDRRFRTCSAPIFKQSVLVSFLHLPDPELIFAIVAIMGDGDSTLPSLYQQMNMKKEASHLGIILNMSSWYRSIVDIYFGARALNIQSFKNFKERIETFKVSSKLHEHLSKNCRMASKVYMISRKYLDINILKSTSTLQCLSSCESSNRHILGQYREGDYPDIVISAVCMQTSLLSPEVGDPSQPPAPQFGQKVRRVMYGLAKPLMSDSQRECIKEYQPNTTSEELWDYEPVEVQPELNYEHLSVDRIYKRDMKQTKEEAKEVICDVLGVPVDILRDFSLNERYLLGIITTHCWAQHLFRSRHLDYPKQLITALVLNFLFCPEKEDVDWDSQSECVEMYHALLEWQHLYLGVSGLNAMLLSPFLELPLTNILHGLFVKKLALMSNADIARYRERLTSTEKRDLYDKIIGVLHSLGR